MLANNTIFALATSPGRSGVAIARISGPQALPALMQLTGMTQFTPRMAHYATFTAPGGDVMDRGLALYFKAPHSFTGEDVAELHMHGSLAVIRALLEALGAMEGLRPAEPGEFSRRAYGNGKMDLLEAEGLADLIAAETPAQKAQALRQMQGELSGYYEELRHGVIRSLAHLEAYIDFPDEDIPDDVVTALENDLTGLQRIIADALADGQRGERIRSGIHVVILGAPNAGKSSLLNMLARREAAIVSARAGTTRDVIEVHMDIAGFPVILADTAGIRAAVDDLEEEGVRRALERAECADIKLVLFDGGLWPQKDAASAVLLDERALRVVSKCDLLHNRNLEQGAPLFLSTRTGEGIDRLLQVLEHRIIVAFSGASAPLITQTRHRKLLKDASKCLENARKEPILELKCEELRLAAQAIGKITGKIQVDDVLDVVFSQFCIGK